MTQRLKFLQRNFNTTLGIKQDKEIYTTIPERLRDFESRVNDNLQDGWRLHSTIPESINGASCPILVLVRDQ